jgi:hypothetical protein
MATVLEECTIEEQRCSCVVLWAKGLNAKDIHKEMFPIYGGKYLSRKAVHSCGSRNVANISLMTKRLKRRCESGWDNRQILICCVFRRTGKAMGQAYQCWWKICRGRNVFPRFEYRMFYVLYPFVFYLLTLPRTLRINVTYIHVYIRNILNINETFVMLFCLK